MERISNIIEGQASFATDSFNISSSNLTSNSLSAPLVNPSKNKTQANSPALANNSASTNNPPVANNLRPSGLLDNDSIWSNVLEQLAEVIDAKVFAAWFKNTSLRDIRFNDKEINSKENVAAKPSIHLNVTVPTKFTRDHVKSNYSNVLIDSIKEVFGDLDVLINYEVVPTKIIHTKSKAEELVSENKKVPTISDNAQKEIRKSSNNISTPEIKKYAANNSSNSDNSNSNLNLNYNFSNFVVGTCNQFAHAACLKVCENPGTAYNPLLIYGGVGLGKTHLANAVGNAAKRRKKNSLLVSSETFVTELIASLKTNTMEKFRAKFRSLDVLIIDDIQFIIGKERTQEEFFHTFNELYGKNKQIIITSDKLPQDLIGLEERLRTRFASGLSVDLQAPDFETRVAILSNKAESCGLSVSSEVARLIANRIDTNVRELEGALTRLQALCSLLGEEPSLQLAQKVIDTIAPSRSKELTTDYIKQVVAKQFAVSINDLTGKRRTQNIAIARQVAMYLCRKHTARSFPEIGALFGGRDHSTVIHAIRCINERMPTDDILRDNVERIAVVIEGVTPTSY